MPLWPFRRRSRRKRGRASTLEDDGYGGQAASTALPPRSQTVPELTPVNPPALERQPSKKQRTETNKLHRRARAYSFSPGRHDSVRVSRKNPAADVDPRLADHGVGAKPSSGMDAVRDEMLWRVPTLHNKRDGDHLPRKVSSKKRRKEDQQREAEIKALSTFVPVRPATEDWMAGRPMKKESRRIRSAFGGTIKGGELDKFHRSSDVSLPLQESIDSALSSDSDHIAYKISALAALSPRPTLRCTTHPRSVAGVRDVSGVARRPSQQRKLIAPIPEATLKAHKRVDDLADDLSASDLRELMERDQRRRARKRQLEQEKLDRRIARRAEKQKAVEADAVRHGRESPPNLERGVLGREDVGLGLDPASAIITSSRIRHSEDQPNQRDGPAQSGDIDSSRDGERPGPLAAFHRVDSHPLQPPEAPSERREDPAPTLTSPASKGSFRRKLSRSKSPQESEIRTEPTEQAPRDFGATAKAQRSWTSFFRWGNKSKRGSGGPSSFSNTSRDSMQMTPAPTPPVIPMPRLVSSGVPKRTMSRFREDLPELPISPPASRMQSPEADAIPPALASVDLHSAVQESVPSPVGSRPRQDTPVSEPRSDEGMRETPSTSSPVDEPGVSPEPQAMSLASIDSEGSWFSGRLSKKRKSSGIMEHGPGLGLPRETPESEIERRPELEITNDDMNITDDDYLSRLAPTNTDRAAWNRKSTGEARPSSDWGDEEAHWGNVRGQQPKVVRSGAVGRVKSREGLLRFFGEEGQSATVETVDPDDHSDGSDSVGLERATSIDYGKAHARRISAGSARLFSISPRSSVDAKHALVPSREKDA